VVPPLIREKKRLLSMQVDLLKEGGKEFNLVYYRELKSAQVRLLLISEPLAKKGISPLINTLVRDPDISQRLFLVVVKGDFDEYIRHQLLKQENLDYFIYRIFKHYESKNQGEMTVVNLHQFQKKLHSPFAYRSCPCLRPAAKISRTRAAYKHAAVENGSFAIGQPHSEAFFAANP
jgi:spore germination protein